MAAAPSPLSGPAILFAEGGAAAHAPADSIEAVRLARRLGATGLATVVRTGPDGTVLVGRGGRWRRRPPPPVLLADLWPEVEGLELALDVDDDATVDALVADAARHRTSTRVWLCHPDLDRLARWGERHDDIRLALTGRAVTLPGGPERAAAAARDRGVGAIRLPRPDWTAGRVALFHRFGRRAWASGAAHTRMVRELVHMGIDAVGSDHVDRLVDGALPAT